MSSPARSRPEPFDLAVVALSARALAASARRAGLKALAIDLFADDDTREHAALAVRAKAHRRGSGFDRKDLHATIEAHAPAGLPVVLGAGFEHATGLMRAIGRRNPIVGASPEQVALLKDPARFAALLAALDVPHPVVALAAPERDRFDIDHRRHARACACIHDLDTELHDPRKSWIPGSAGHDASDGDWLSKRAGASGGAHIRRVESAGRRRYLQRFVDGRAISALCLANGRDARIIGFSEQWTDPAPRAPFRYGGAVGPIDLPRSLIAEVEAALVRIVGATGLTGLASADLIVRDKGTNPSFVLLEINPRPGATLDVFDCGDRSPSLLQLHLDACAGTFPHALPVMFDSYAAAIVYAERTVRIVALRRPLWTADWPSCDETLPVGAPVCTILAAAPSPSAARALVMERRAALLASLRAASPAPKNVMVPA